MLDYDLLEKKPEVEYIDGENPHFVIRDPLCDEELSQYLSDRFPYVVEPVEDNVTARIMCQDALKVQEINPVWKSIFRECVSQEFFYAMMEIFRIPFKKNYGAEAHHYLMGSLPEIRDHGKEQNVVTDCQFVINSRTSGGTTVREPHVDNPVEIYALLWYFKHPYDKNGGGDLNLYRHKFPGVTYFGKNNVSPAAIELAKTVKYENNVLVGFLNTPKSIHGVSIREKTNYPRRYINIIAEQRKPLFKTCAK